MSKTENPQSFTNKNLPFWAIDFTFGELYSYGRVSAPAILSNINRERISADPVASILAPACRLYCRPDSDPTDFERALDRYPSDGHPVWPALARHVARRTVPDDDDWTLLEDLVKHPEKTDPPLRWALKYIVRGDIRMDDGQIITLDQLADELEMERLPYLEPMPEHFEVDWEE